MCDCIEKIDARLVERNSKLDIGFTFNMNGQPGYAFPALSTSKIDKRNRDKMGAIPTFCAFCGTAYREETRSTDATALALLQRAEAFIAGFEDDEAQEGVEALLTDIRSAIGNSQAEPPASS
jgi:hypothetical protein